MTSASDPTATIESPCTATAAASGCSGSMVRIVPPRNTTSTAPVGVGSALGVVFALGVIDPVGAFVVGAQASNTAPAATGGGTAKELSTRDPVEQSHPSIKASERACAVVALRAKAYTIVERPRSAMTFT